jgi:hypothetical protein
MLNGEPVDFICNNCILQQMPQIDIYDSKDLDNNTTQNSTIIAHVTNMPEEKENIFELVVLSKATPHHPFVNQFLY